MQIPVSNRGRHKINVYVVGVDGSRWHISGTGAGKEGVWLMPEHVGLLDTPVETLWRSGASQVGATFQAARFMPRELSLPVVILDTKERDWQTVDSRWRKAWSYFEDSTVEVESQSGIRRFKCRLKLTPEYQLVQSGQLMGSAKALMHVCGGDPLWYSHPETETWEFDGIHWVGEVEISNPSDMPMWLQWTCAGPLSIILPDKSFETRPGFPGYEHQDRMITLPFQPTGVDVIVDTDPDKEQVVSPQKRNWGAKMNGQFFTYAVPPWTPKTKIKVAVNPLPWIADAWYKLKLPGAIPTQILVKCAEFLTKILSPLGTDTVLSLTPAKLADFVNEAMQKVFAFFGDADRDDDGYQDAYQWVQEFSKMFTKKTIGELVGEMYVGTLGQFVSVPGSGLQVRMVRRWTRPYGLE